MGKAADVLTMETIAVAREMALADHAEAWWREQGKVVPARDTDQWQEMYEAWVEWTFSDLHGKEQSPRRQSKRLMS